jgi:hypothetical protein
MSERLSEATLAGTPERVLRPGKEDSFELFTNLVRNSLKNLYSQEIEKERVDEALRRFEEFVTSVTEATNPPPTLARSIDDREDRRVE